MRKIFYIHFIILVAFSAFEGLNAQQNDSSKIFTKKLIFSSVGHAALTSGSFIALNKAWYSKYEKTHFHFFNDLGEWLQMDKAGHIWTSYQLARASTSIWKWAGLNPEKSIFWGSISSFTFQSIVELQDAYSEKWGFSVYDMLANVTGISTFAIQEKFWKKQRIQIKFQYFPIHYSTAFSERKKQLFGSSLPEQILKDYNSQTYWIGINLYSFFPKSTLPKWLNISFGYNARTMLGGRDNSWIDKNGNLIDADDQRRYRRFFLSADLDLTRIPAKNKTLKSLFFALNAIKIPLPTLEWNTLGEIKMHPIY